MRKLTLDLAHLKVVSFAATPAATARGTVNAHVPPPPTLWDDTCMGSCGFTACGDYTCQHTCPID